MKEILYVFEKEGHLYTKFMPIICIKAKDRHRKLEVVLPFNYDPSWIQLGKLNILGKIFLFFKKPLYFDPNNPFAESPNEKFVPFYESRGKLKD